MDIPLSRQPVFDAHEQVAGYRISHTTPRPEEDSPAAHAAHRLLVNAFLGVGIRQLAGGHPAFIAAGASLLRGGSLELLDPAAILVELTGEDALTPEALRTVTRLRQSGYRFVVDLSALRGAAGAMPDVLGLVDIVRVDDDALPDDRLASLASGMHERGITLLADNVPGRARRDQLAGFGFSLFQGFEFSRPEVVTSRELGVQHLRMLELLRQIRSVDVVDAQIAQAFRADVSLSYKLLRMVNSAAIGASGLQSIEHALRLLGREMLYRWLLLLFLSSGPPHGVRAELVQTALARARLSENLAQLAGLSAHGPALYTIGLLSLLDLLLGRPMEEIVRHLGFSPDVTAALVDQAGPLGGVLRIVAAYDQGRWPEFEAMCEACGVPTAGVPSLYLEALTWAAKVAPPIAAPGTREAPARVSFRRQQAAQPQL